MSISNSSKIVGILLSALVFAYCVDETVSALIDVAEAPDTRLEEYAKISNEIDVVALGSSHGTGLFFPLLGLHGYSFNGNGMNLYESNLKLKALVAHEPQIRRVLLPFGEGEFSFDRNTKSESAEREQLAYAPWPTADTLREFPETWRIVYAKTINAVTARLHANARVRSYLSGATADLSPCASDDRIESPDEYGFRHGYFRIPAEERCLRETVERTTLSRRLQLEARTMPLADVRRDNIGIVAEMADLLAKRNGGQLVLVRMPVTREYHQSAVKPYYDADAEIAERLAGRVPNIIYVDLRGLFWDTAYLNNNQVFFDNDHLTLAGAQIASGVLAAKIGRGATAGQSRP